MTLFNYEFMQRAIIVSIIISIITPLIGNIIVLKRLSTIGDSLSHGSLAGVVIGLYLRKNPIFFAIIFSIVCALMIEFIRSFFKKYEEISTSIVTSFAVGIVAVLSGFTNSNQDLHSYLFGSIITVTSYELNIIFILAILVIIVILVLYRELFYITFDEQSALISGINTKIINFGFTILTSIVIAISAKAVGTLIISSLLVIPVACSLQISSSYKKNVIFSIFFALFFCISGIFISYYMNFKSGGTIILIGVCTLLTVMLIKKIFKF